MQTGEHTLAERLGVTVHVSPLRRKLTALSRAFPLSDSRCLEDWMVRVANIRGARIVTPDSPTPANATTPSPRQMPTEELVVALCQPQCLDRPQILRLAAQLITRGGLDLHRLILTAKRERAGRILAELARQAARVDARHLGWLALRSAFRTESAFRSPLLHWTRMAQPVMQNGRCNAASWRLVA